MPNSIGMIFKELVNLKLMSLVCESSSCSIFSLTLGFFILFHLNNSDGSVDDNIVIIIFFCLTAKNNLFICFFVCKHVDFSLYRVLKFVVLFSRWVVYSAFEFSLCSGFESLVIYIKVLDDIYSFVFHSLNCVYYWRVIALINQI